MQRDESAVAVALRKLIPGVKGDAERRRVRRQEHVGNDRLVHEIGVRADKARIVVLADGRYGQP